MPDVIERKAIAGTIPTIGDQKEYWDDRWSKSPTPNDYQIRRGREIISFLHSIDLEKPKILDIGCGTGWFTAELNKIGESTGIDLSEDAINQAKYRYPHIKYLCGNLYGSSFPNSSFDVIVAMEVLPHVEDQLGFINMISSILKPGGYLALSMVNKFAINRAEWDHGPESHIIQWVSMRDLRKLLRPHFAILKTKSIIPIGDRGILRVVNSHKLNRIARLFFSERSITAFKEHIGCGYTHLILAQKSV